VSDCERFESTFEAYVAGDLDEAALGPLLVHCRECEDCRRLMELHRDLTGLASRAPEPDGTVSDALAARVLGRLPSADSPRVDGGPGPASAKTQRRGMGWLPRAAAALAASVLLFLAGLAAGHARGGAGASGDAGLTARLISAIRVDAAGNRALADVEDSRFTYSDVSFRRVKDDRVALDFDVTTHVKLVEPVKSALVQDVLVQSLLNPGSAGTRLRAMALAAGEMEPKLKEALFFAMRRDESLAVRLEALTILADRLGDPEVESAVLATLRDDDSVQMRLLALDSLAAHSVDRGRIREVIQEKVRPGNEALMVRLAEHEKRI
jgi:hypothetical protein